VEMLWHGREKSTDATGVNWLRSGFCQGAPIAGVRACGVDVRMRDLWVGAT